MASPSFLKMATATAYTKRSPAISGGKVGEPTLCVPEFRCTPIDPLTPEIAIRFGIEAPYVGYQCFAEGSALDVKQGDTLIARRGSGERAYNVKAAGQWEWLDTQFLAIVLEDVKGSHAGQ